VADSWNWNSFRCLCGILSLCDGSNKTMREEIDPISSYLDKNITGAKIVRERIDKDFKDGDICPNCYKGKLEMTKAEKSDFQRRYHYLLFCKSCGFKYLRKFAITGGGRIRSTGFTDSEFRKAEQKFLRGR
jgi:RNase P subunit RPR2